MLFSSVPAGRARRVGAALALSTLPFTMAACGGEEEPAEDAGIVEEEVGEEQDE